MNDIHNIKSYDIAGFGLPRKVDSVVVVAHMRPLQAVEKKIRLLCGEDIKLEVSFKSSYRSVKWEESKGRSGFSEHTYKKLGATDVTCANFSENKDLLLKCLIEETDYTRIAMYNSFIHVDYKNERSDAYVYDATSGVWKRKYSIYRE